MLHIKGTIKKKVQKKKSKLQECVKLKKAFNSFGGLQIPLFQKRGNDNIRTYINMQPIIYSYALRIKNKVRFQGM